MGKLSVARVRSAPAGRHGDGDGLYLLVKPSGARSWLLRVQQGHARRDIGLGSVDVTGRAAGDPLLDVPLLQRRVLTLGEARDKAAMLRQFARAGLDPLAERDRERIKLSIPTFAKAVELAHAELGKGMEPKEAAAFKASLEAHAVPKLGALRVDRIHAGNLIEALAKIWIEKPQQARKVRRRIIRVLAFAKAKRWRLEPMPSEREISDGLARQPRAGNFAALPYAEVPNLVAAELGKAETPARLALLFTILTGSRSGEVRQATWAMIDLDAKLWRCPAEIMKARRAHTVTLSSAAIALLERAAELYGKEGLVFPSSKPGKALSDMALSKMLRSAGASATVHGFRSSFRDWAAEKMPKIPAEAAELALAHRVGDRTVSAYRRSPLTKQRFQLLEAWGRFAAPALAKPSEPGRVVKLERRA